MQHTRERNRIPSNARMTLIWRVSGTLEQDVCKFYITMSYPRVMGVDRAGNK